MVFMWCLCALFPTGHVIFEMACGYELTTLVPGEQDYSAMPDSEVVDVLQVIFDRDEDGNFTSSIDQVRVQLSHRF